MKIKRLYTSNYKNLVRCTIEPTGILALTGCNGSGKSNLLEVPEFVALIISGSDEAKDTIFKYGSSPLGGSWCPFVKTKEEVFPFVFELDAIILVGDREWEVDYLLEVKCPEFIEPYKYKGVGEITKETVKIKEMNKSGQKKTILNRIGNETHVFFETSRKKLAFRTKSDMSAFQALEVREADDYPIDFPVFSELHRALTAFNLIKLNPEKLLIAASHQYTSPFERRPGSTIDFFPMYSLLQEIKKDPSNWNSLMEWLKRLCNIDHINFYEKEPDHSPQTDESKQDEYKIASSRYIFVYQQDRVLWPEELSTGCAMLLGLLVAIHSFLPLSGAVILEEPETYLHPKAIIDLITLLREVSEYNTVIFSTHSPVTLNSMTPSEVTLMQVIENGFVTTRNVSEIKEAIDTLNRGYISFGDLLQSNFTVDSCH